MSKIIRILKGLISSLLVSYDKTAKTDIRCSLGDLLLQGEKPDNGQLTVVSRYYDILRYKSGEDKDFSFQNSLSYALWGKNHDKEKGNKRFMSLIASYDKYGYKEGSRIILYKGGEIANGTHRIAMNLYHEVWDINASVLWRRNRNRKHMEWYTERGLAERWQQIVDDTMKKIEDVLFSRGVAFGMMTDTVDDNLCGRAEILLKSWCKRYVWYKGEWGGYLMFSLVNPDYEVKKGKLYSKEAVRLYKALSEDVGIPLLSKTFNCSEGRELFLSITDKNNFVE